MSFQLDSRKIQMLLALAFCLFACLVTESASAAKAQANKKKAALSKEEKRMKAVAARIFGSPPPPQVNSEAFLRKMQSTHSDPQDFTEPVKRGAAR